MNPPKKIKFNGLNYNLGKSGYYSRWGSGDEETLLHRVIWSEVNGPIPEGFHVHHMNGIRHDNRIENLQLLHGGEHIRRHMIERLKQPEHRDKNLKVLAAAREKGRKWHSTEAGKKWHSENAKKSMEKRLLDPAYKAKAVAAMKKGVEKAHAWHQTPEGQKWHSENGKRNAANRVYVPATCKVCGADFKTWASLKASTCSKRCWQIDYVKRKKTQNPTP